MDEIELLSRLGAKCCSQCGSLEQVESHWDLERLLDQGRDIYENAYVPICKNCARQYPQYDHETHETRNIKYRSLAASATRSF